MLGPDRRPWLALLLGLTLGLQARAQPADLFEVRARGGAVFHDGTERDSGPGLRYQGVSGADVALQGWAWPLLDRHLGLFASGSYQAYTLLQGTTSVTRAELWQATAGVAGRLLLGPARLSLQVGWAFDQLPVFGTEARPSFTPVARHALLPGLRVQVDLGPVTLEGWGQAPIGLWLEGLPDGSAWGLQAGLSARVRLFATGALDWGLLAEGSWTREVLGDGELSTVRTAVRASGALDLRWREPPPPARLRIQARRGPEPAAGLVLAVRTAAGETRLGCDPDGEAVLAAVPPGPVVVSAAGPEAGDAEQRGEARPGEELRLTLQLPAPPPRMGALEAQVRGPDGEPFPGAEVAVGDQVVPSDARGRARLEGLTPGTLAVTVKAEGMLPVEDAVVVVPGQATALEVTLRPPARKQPATLKGLVRSARGGEPVRARLEVRERRLRLEADPSGAFSVSLPGGTYTVRITAVGYRAQVKVVSVKDGDQAILNVDLFPAR